MTGLSSRLSQQHQQPLELFHLYFLWERAAKINLSAAFPSLLSHFSSLSCPRLEVEKPFFGSQGLGRMISHSLFLPRLQLLTQRPPTSPLDLSVFFSCRSQNCNKFLAPTSLLNLSGLYSSFSPLRTQWSRIPGASTSSKTDLSFFFFQTLFPST